jgi:prepilin-type processing-associated H-X9-DG protein
MSSDMTSIDGAFGWWKLTGASKSPTPYPTFTPVRGLSNVALYSEMSAVDSLPSRRREFPRSQTAVNPYEAPQAFLEGCRAVEINHERPDVFRRGGFGYEASAPMGPYFNHAAAPNLFVCLYKAGIGIYSANSDHAGGVACVYADGHVVFVADGIDPDLWSSQGDFR